MVAFLPITFYFLTQACPIPFKRMAGVLWRPLTASLIMLIAVGILHAESIHSPLVTLALDVITGALIYSTAMLAFWHIAGRPQGVEKKILDRIIFYFNRVKNTNGLL